jgi:hypothetical protein
MTEEQHYPRVGQVVTLIAVRNMQAAVLGATVQDDREHHLTLIVEETDRLSAPPVAVGGRVKLLYGSGPTVWKLAGSIESIVTEAGQIVVHCPAPPQPGERREFIRAEMVVGLYVRRLSETDADRALDAVAAATPPPKDDPRWVVQLVDLSGSGIRIRLSEDVQADELLEVRLRIQSTPPRALDLLGRVVRTAPAEGGGHEVALRFESLTDAQQDTLINQAFRVRYEQLGG